jgi:YbbR domain-containing protein
LRRLFTHNPGLKVLAIVISLVLWILVTGEGESARIFQARINYIVADDQVMVGEAPGSVAVSLRGTALALGSFDPARLGLDIDLRGGTTGERKIPIDKDRQVRGIPAGLAVDAITPQILTLQVDRKIRRSLPVSPRIEGAPSPGCRLVGYSVNPTEVQVEGPESQAGTMSSVRTERIDLAGRCSTMVLTVGADPDRPDVRLFTARPVLVTLRMEDTRNPTP